jgi:plastocyanin
VAGAVVYLDGVKASAARPVRLPQTILQRNLQFEPQVTVVMKGDRVDFPNKESNSVDHNVFSPGGPGKIGFDLGRYGKGKSESWVFSRTGDFDIYCNLHPDMKAKVKVVDTPFYVKTDAAGAFRITGVPAGEYVIKVWRPYSLEVTGQLTVVAGADSAAVELKFTSAPSTPGRHKRLDGTGYPDY